MSIYGFAQNEFIAGMLLLALALFSIICTITTLWLIYDMKRRNGYLLLIWNLTISQFMYDLPFFMLPFYKNRVCEDVMNFMFIFAGMAVALWTNVISLVLYYIVEYLQSFDIYGYYPIFAGCIFIPSCVLASLAIVYYGKYNHFELIYYWIRIASILFNLIIHAMISYKLQVMAQPVSSSTVAIAPKDDPVRVLASRIKYYPIVQIVSRAGAAWYEFAYGFTSDSYSKRDMSPTQTISLYFYGICVPTAGIGYFIVFLIVQPAAYQHLKTKLHSLWKRIVKFVSYCFSCGQRDFYTSRDEASMSREDTLSSVFIKGSQPLLGNPAFGYMMSEMDEDELSQVIDQRYLTRSGSGTADENNALTGATGNALRSPVAGGRIETANLRSITSLGNL